MVEQPETERRRILFVGIGCVVAISVLAVYLFLPAAAPPTVTVTSAQMTIHQGTIAGGFGWFGANSTNFSNGFPFSTTAGSTFTLDWQGSNLDRNFSHTLVALTLSAPFSLARTTPSLPLTIGPLAEGSLEMVVQTPSSGGSWALNLTLFTA